MEADVERERVGAAGWRAELTKSQQEADKVMRGGSAAFTRP